ncbi:MAG TPA: helix-turn-helix transcriptional regulator [Actinophytocola sp.]|uniref:helix-turn-helix transcriptional regulator n=1 Tax=Actinophytocola sp. TaxID=1872138 RepID=UPI002DBD47C4|nr:helix-turn-helix transcriptional regulator [Actinophytocola sp.]HEU5469345.1 helix-turn-helix transcriptional regulator [Actinophytocola sp.]
MTAMTAAAPNDAVRAELAWLAGDAVTAIDAADRALTAGTDPDCRAAGVAAAAAAADGALADAAARWRRVAGALDGAPAATAAARAALAAALSGDVGAASGDLAEAHVALPGSAPRGLTVLLDGVDATVAAVRGCFARAARKLAGLAVATVPADPFAAERWDDLAVTVTIAGGGDRTARDMLAASQDRPGSTRRRLLAAWLDLRAGRLTDAREALAAASDVPILRRDAVLAAAITVGLARRAGDDDALRATWHRVAPVVTGSDVELLLLDAWGELSVAAARVSPDDRDTVVDAVAAAVARAGAPTWAVAAEAWWRLHRAVVTDDAIAAARAAGALGTVGGPHQAATAAAWAAVLSGRFDAAVVTGTAEALADAGSPWEAAALCGAAAARLGDSGAAKDLLGTGRALRSRILSRTGAAGGLSDRERAVGELLLDGLTQKEIGARLYISPKTVEQHVARLRQKLVAANRAELIAALRSRLGPM